MTAPRPVWSVMVPTYNPDAAFLREAVDSVRRARAAGTMELVIVDDGTTEQAGLRLLDALQGEGLRVERSRDRLGLGANFNRCIDIANGEIIHILHQDDAVMPAFYERMRRGFDAEPGLGAAISGIRFMDGHGQVKRDGHRARREAGVLANWIEHVAVNLAIQTAGIVVHADVYRRLGGFRTDLNYVLDWEMWTRIACDYPIWCDPEPLAQRREHARSESARLSRMLLPWVERRRCLGEICDRLPVSVRRCAHRAARGHLARLARSEAGERVGASEWRAALASLAGGFLCGPGQMVSACLSSRAPKPVSSRAPMRTDRSGARRKRVLLISEFVPYPDMPVETGALQRLDRNLQTLRHAGEVDAMFLIRFAPVAAHHETVRSRWPFLQEVAFQTLPAGTKAWPGVSGLLWAWRGAVSFYHARPDPAVADASVARRMGSELMLLQPDLVFAFRIGPAGALLRVADLCPPVVTDLDDVEHVRVARKVGSRTTLPGWVVRLSAAMAVRAERAAARLSSAVLVCSDHDAGHLAAVAPGAPIRVVENTARAAGAQPLPQAAQAVFVGNMNYPPNARGAVWLAREVWPMVRARLPSAKLVIVGRGGPDLGIEDGAGGVEVAGVVADLEPVYAASRIAVCPVAEGSGTRIKLIEAALHGRASVSTPVGAEGLDFEPERDILIADTADAFAAACLRLLGEGGDAQAMAASALQTARERYSPERRHRSLMDVLDECLGETGGAAMRDGAP